MYMKRLKSLVISSVLLLSSSYLDAMQSYNELDNNNSINNIDDTTQQSQNTFGNYNNIGDMLNEQALNICLNSTIGTVNNTSHQTNQQINYKDFMDDYNYNGIWKSDKIPNINSNLEVTLFKLSFKDILQCFNDSIFFKKCSNTELGNKSTEQYLKDLIKQKIIRPKKSVKECLITLGLKINNESENEIFNLILEDFIDKYIFNEISNNKIDLYKIFNSKFPSGTMLQMVQDYYCSIYDKFLENLNGFKNFQTKFTENKKYYEELICNYMIKKFEIAFQKYLINFIENNGWEACIRKYLTPSYIKKRIIPQIFEYEIIHNNMSIYHLSGYELFNKYHDSSLQKRWLEYIYGKLITLYYQYIYEDNSINDMIDQFSNPVVKEYATKKYMEFFENDMKEAISKNIPLEDILKKYQNKSPQTFAKLSYLDLIKENNKTKNKNNK